MDPAHPAASDGPDGSSLKPVSSLRAQFENMTKTKPNNESHGATAPSRPISPSPAPKPERPRDSVTLQQPREPPAVPKQRPRDKLSISAAPLPPAFSPGSASAPRSPVRSALSTPLSPKLAAHPPSFMIQPPQSPPKGGADVAVGERPSFVNPEAGPKTSPSPAAKTFKIPSRPHTPVPEPRKSPRLGASQPPSPPPPRRSAELRREREAKPVPPPSAGHSEKPSIPSRASYMAESHPSPDPRNRAAAAEKRSPFSSPPGSHAMETDDDDDIPPMLPKRPRAPVQASQQLQEAAAARSAPLQVGFEPPPVHPSRAGRRRDKEDVVGAAIRSAPSLPPAEDLPPALPARPPQAAAAPDPLPTRNGASPGFPPPRPPRPSISTRNLDNDAAPSTIGQRRVPSNPAKIPPTSARATGNGGTAEPAFGRAAASDPHMQTPTTARAFSSAVPSEATMTPVSATQTALPASSRLAAATATYPDSSNTNRRPPYIRQGAHEVHTRYDGRVLDVCGELVCTSGSLTRVWSLLDGELTTSFAMGEGIKGTAVAFKPGPNVDEEGARVWIGTSTGELMEADVAAQSIVSQKANAHSRHEIVKIYRHFNELWTLDESGALLVWGPDAATLVPSLANNPHQSYRVPKGHTFSTVAGDELWHAAGREIRVFQPTTDGRAPFQVLARPLYQDGAGEITSGTLLPADPDKVLLGHNDGRVSIYSRADYSCAAVVSLSTYKINALAAVGDCLWAGYNTGKICVYDMGQTPWTVKKDWQAHDNPVVKIIADRSSFYQLDRYQVVSLGADNAVRTWDGLLQDDWLENEMRAKDAEFCQFETLRALIMTWNAGASTPNSLRYSDSDASFIQGLLQASGSPDIVVFGFQELVDLEDKTATASSDQERMSHQYRDWRDFLIRSFDDYMSGELYHLLHTAPLVGLFTCIFVKADLRDRISNVSSAEVKRGMGGLHGNKGAIVVRFMVDDTSLCFVNCHLAAGQSQATHRHNDIAAILDATILPAERDVGSRTDRFVGGGDGTMILDHELCFLNGDLNYRIDTMSRDTVVTAVRAGNLAKLLERDQLLVARRRNPGFRLRAFEELPIAFAPTYKYDVGTDNYDSSEKKRSPAWCDRLLFRGRGRIEQLDYRRHEVRVSDHRPVSGRFELRVKRISPKRRALAWADCQQRWQDLWEAESESEKMFYLTQVIGYDRQTAQMLIRDRPSRTAYRSPSRQRE